MSLYSLSIVLILVFCLVPSTQGQQTCFNTTSSCPTLTKALALQPGLLVTQATSDSTWYKLEQLTLEFWLRAQNLNAIVTTSVISCLDSETGYGFYLTPLPSLTWNIGPLFLEFALNENVWIHVTGVSYTSNSSSLSILYINGEEWTRSIATSPRQYLTYIPNNASANLLVFGGPSFSGQLDEIRFWNFPKTNNQVRYQFNRPYFTEVLLGSVIPTGLVAYYSFELENDNNQITDHVGNHTGYFSTPCGCACYSSIGCNSNGSCDTGFQQFESSFAPSVSESYCNCLSSFAGRICDESLLVTPVARRSAQQTTCPIPYALNNETRYVPSLLQPNFSSNFLVIPVTQPLVFGRQTFITLNRFTIDTGNLTSLGNALKCSYPGPNWVKSLANCAEFFVATFLWPDVSRDCFVDLGNVSQLVDSSGTIETFRSFAARVDVSIIEPVFVDGLIIYRSIYYTFQLIVTFQVTTTVSVNVSVIQSPLNVTAYYISFQQIFVDQTPLTATVVVETILPWPYFFDRPPTIVCVSGPNCGLLTLSVLPNLNFSRCTNDTNYCEQSWYIQFLLGSACTLDGEYELTFTNVSCRTTSCLQGDIVLRITLQSENICPIVSVNVTLSGNLTLFSDPNLTNPSNIYVSGQTIWGQGILTSAANIITSSLINLSLIRLNPRQTLVLRFNRVNLIQGLTPTIDFSGNTVIFGLLIDENVLFTNHPSGPDWSGILIQNGFEEFIFEAYVEVTLENVKKMVKLSFPFISGSVESGQVIRSSTFQFQASPLQITPSVDPKLPSLTPSEVDQTIPTDSSGSLIGSFSYVFVFALVGCFGNVLVM